MRPLVKFLVAVTWLVLFFSPPVSAAQTYSIQSETANIRSGPGTTFEVMWQVEKYYPISVIEKKGKWYQFRDFEGDTGWVHNSLLGKSRSVITVKDNCLVRSGPGQQNKARFMARRGVPFALLDRKGNWLKVRHAEGLRGWIYKNLVRVY